MLLLRREVQAERSQAAHRHVQRRSGFRPGDDPRRALHGQDGIRIGTPPTKKPAPPPAPTAPEEDKDSSTGHEGDDAEDPGTAGGTAGKGPTPDSKRRSSRGAVDEDDVRRSKRPHRRSEDVEAIIQAEHPGWGSPKAANKGKGNTPGVHIRTRSGECKCGFCDKIAKTETGLKKHVTSARTSTSGRTGSSRTRSSSRQPPERAEEAAEAAGAAEAGDAAEAAGAAGAVAAGAAGAGAGRQAAPPPSTPPARSRPSPRAAITPACPTPTPTTTSSRCARR